MTTSASFTRKISFLVGAGLTAFLLASTRSEAQAPATTLTLKTLHTFHQVGDGAYPYGGLLRAENGDFYGTTYAGGAGDLNGGTVFRLAPDGTFTTLISYESAAPFSTLAAGLDGSLFGTASGGGQGGNGFIFRLPPTGANTLINAFDNTRTGSSPQAGLVLGADGGLYGTTTAGGANATGTVFRLDPQGNLTLLHTFNRANGEGVESFGVLVQGRDGSFYGTTYAGGAHDRGTVFKVSTLGVLTTVYSFAALDDGGNPRAGLLLGGDGNFYGTTNSGGNGAGTVFQLTPQGRLTVLHAFNPASGEGAEPAAPLIDGGDGRYYGTTTSGGVGGNGTIFAVTPAGDFTTLYSFTGGVDGAQPFGPLAQAGNGIFYGATGAGGESRGLGTVYRLNLYTPPQVPGSLSFAAALTTVDENAGLVTLTVNREGGATGGVSVQYTTADGTAKAGTDYLATNGYLSWRAEDTTPKSFTVSIADLGLSDGSTHGFSVRLSDPSGGASLGAIPTAGVGILENDPPGPTVAPIVTLTVLGDGFATVGGGKGKILFSRDGDKTQDLMVTYVLKSKARNGTDFDLLPGTLTIPAGKASYKLKIKAKATAQYKGTTGIKVQPTLPKDGSYVVSPPKVKVKFVNPN